ncbi:MAG: hypothetical protein GKR94_12555 [Gammaproteobacteria bacterium]|nr:hypothetical protein [Gammaproteobacteria bacterium]
MHDNEVPKERAAGGESMSTLRAADAIPTATDVRPAKVIDAPGVERQRIPDMNDTVADALVGAMETRIGQLEHQAKRLRYSMFAAILLIAFLIINQFSPANVTVQQTLMESKEFKLIDNSGNTRLFLRMYSKVPVFQLLDSNGKPRMSLGLRFDDTPFIDLSDKIGRTRATFEMTQEDAPTLKLFNEDGDVSFAIN